MVKNIGPIWVMIYFDKLIIAFHHCYNFNLIKFRSYYKHNFVYFKDLRLFKYLTHDKEKDFVAISFSEYFKLQVKIAS